MRDPTLRSRRWRESGHFPMSMIGRQPTGSYMGCEIIDDDSARFRTGNVSAPGIVRTSNVLQPMVR